MNPAHVTTKVTVFVEVTKTNQVKLEYDTDRVTADRIKAVAGVPADNDLAVRHGQKLEPVPTGEFEIHNGEHFVAVPPGSVS